MAFIVPDVVRFVVHQSEAGKQIANILDYEITDPSFPDLRGAAIVLQAEVILDSWDLYIRPFQVNNLSCDSVSWVDLSTSDGSTGSITAGDVATWPNAGASNTEALIQNVAVLIHKNLVGSSRGRRRGRLFMAGHNEGSNETDNPRAVLSTLVSGLNTAWGNFLTDTNQDPGPFTARMVVSHILTRDVDGNPATGDSTPVSSLSTDSTFATQRRRLR